jgi:hypothetical protein
MHFSFFSQGKNNYINFLEFFPLENSATPNVLRALWRRIGQKIHHVHIFGTAFDKNQIISLMCVLFLHIFGRNFWENAKPNIFFRFNSPLLQMF